MADKDKTEPEAVDTSKIQLRRVAGAPLVELTYIPFYRAELDNVPHSNTAAVWHPDPAKSSFEVSADIAKAAVASGFFEVADSSRVKLKEVVK
jgi:hypothetical protein